MSVEISRDGDTVDSIAQRRFNQTDGVTESILSLNPGLASYGVFLPDGLQVNLPPTPAKTKVRDVTRIWTAKS